MKFKANFVEKPCNFQMDDCQIEKVVELSHEDFCRLKIAPAEHQPFLAEHPGCMFSRDGVIHCLLALDQGSNDGVLIDAEGYGYPRIAAYVPGMRDIVSAELDRAADFIIREGAAHAGDGHWPVPFEELEKQLGLTVRVGNGLDDLLLDKLSQRVEVSDISLRAGRIDVAFQPDCCEHMQHGAAKILADLPVERRTALLENAVSSALGLYRGEDLYDMLHNCFGLTIQEIQEQGYLSNQELTDICQVPQQVLEGGMTVRDILTLDGLPIGASLAHKNSVFLVPVEDLKLLTGTGREDFAALLDARVNDIRVDEGTPELLLEGVEASELDRLHDELEAHKQAEEAMGPVEARVFRRKEDKAFTTEQRLECSLEQLGGMAIPPEGCIHTGDISFSDDIVSSGGTLNFQLESGFDLEKLFEGRTSASELRCWVNVYANYDLASGQVRDSLDIEVYLPRLFQADGSVEPLSYALDGAEKDALLRGMEAYCRQRTGQTLQDYSAQVMAEAVRPPDGPSMS